MVIVYGSVRARPDSFEELRALALEHVRRSRTEPGCLSHDVHVHAEEPLRLVFFETWTDRAALAAHFAVPASREFAQAAGQLGAEPPVIRVYQATQIDL